MCNTYLRPSRTHDYEPILPKSLLEFSQARGHYPWEAVLWLFDIILNSRNENGFWKKLGEDIPGREYILSLWHTEGSLPLRIVNCECTWGADMALRDDDLAFTVQ